MNVSSLSRPMRLAGLLALVGLFAFVGCKSTDGGDRDACGEAGGESLEDKFPRWAEASQLQGDPEAGREYFENRMYYAFMTCESCHSFDAGDTMTADADEHTRAGVSVWGAAHRTNIKGAGSDVAALGANACVTTWMGGPEEGMTAQELADMQAFLETGGGANHPTSANLDYQGRSFTIPEILTGGDAERGEGLARTYCQTCHDVGDHDALTGDVDADLNPDKVPTKFLGSLAKRIKDHPMMTNNDYMPGFPDQRMSEQDLLDLLAWFELTE